MTNLEKFNQALLKYEKEKDSSFLSSWISKKKKIDAFEWYHMAQIIQEPNRFMNMPGSSSFIEGTVDIFIQAVSKVDVKTGKISLDKSLSYKFLAQESEEVKDFLNSYKKTAQPNLPWAQNLLGWNLSNEEKFWTHFILNVLEGIEYFSPNEKVNYIKNTNWIFAQDAAFHNRLARYVEYPQYPHEHFMKSVVEYAAQYDKYIIPKNNLQRWGLDEDKLFQCKQWLNVFQTSELAEQLEEKSSTKIKKIKI